MMADIDDLSAEESAALEAERTEQPVAEETEAEALEGAPEDEPAEPPAEEAAGDDAPAKPPKGFVPHGALHSEREARKAAEERAKQFESRLFELLKQQQPAPEQKPPEPEPMPDPIADPEAFSKWQGKQFETLKNQTEQAQKVYAQQQQMEQLRAYAQQAQQAFLAEKPDFLDAHSFLRQSRQRELTAAGYDAQAIAQMVARDEAIIVANAMQRGQNPAAIAYQIAEARGYRPTAADTGDKGAQALESLAQTQKKAAAARSLGAAAGGSSTHEYTQAQILKMSEAEYAKLPEEVRIKALMGRL